MSIDPDHRVVVICGEARRHRYFANRLSERFNVVGVVNERMSPHWGLGFLRRYLELARGFKYKPSRMYAKFATRLIEIRRQRGVYERILGPRCERFELRPGAVQLGVESSVNRPENVERIRALKPDVIAVSGARLLSREIIESARVAAINMHGGLSPYYRGADSIFWTLYNREPEYLGVTIHLLTLGIDSGPLVYTGRPVIEADDNELTLFAKVFRLGSELMCYAVEDALSGRLESVPQWEKGKLYYRKDLNPRAYRELIGMLDRGLLRDWLQSPPDDAHIRLIGDPERLTAARQY